MFSWKILEAFRETTFTSKLQQLICILFLIKSTDSMVFFQFLLGLIQQFFVQTEHYKR